MRSSQSESRRCRSVVFTIIKFLYDPILKASTCTITTLKVLDSSQNEGPTKDPHISTVHMYVYKPLFSKLMITSYDERSVQNLLDPLVIGATSPQRVMTTNTNGILGRHYFRCTACNRKRTMNCVLNATSSVHDQGFIRHGA
jgi:hypothetical protein